MKNSVSQKGLYAFWKYDSFPFLLGGTVTRMDDKGHVETEEFGVGFWFKPLKLMPVKQGRLIREQLKALEGGFRQARDAFLDDWDQKVTAVVEFAEVPARRVREK